MSRVGKKSIPIPNGVSVDIKDNVVTVKGPKGELHKEIAVLVNVKIEEKNIVVERSDDSKISNMNQGLMRSLINNMVTGVTTGFKKDLVLEAREYKAALEGKNLKLSLGFSHPVIVKSENGVGFELDGEKKFAVVGIDKEAVGQISANIRHLRKWEPYTGKGIRYKTEKVRRKERKTGV